MANEVARHEPRAPDLFPETNVAALLDEFSVQQEGAEIFLNRRPTAVEREVLAKRLAEVEPLLEPIETATMRIHVTEDGGRGRDLTAKQVAERALAGFLTGYPSLLNADGPGLVKAYVHDLRKMPLFAILRALDDIKGGRVFDRDHRTGREVPLDKDWPPSSARVYDVAVKVLHRHETERLKIEKVLRTTRLARPEMTPDERAAALPRIQKMAAQVRAAADRSTAVSVEEQEEDRRRREQQDRDRDARHDRELLAEYEAAGLEPVYSGARPVSLALARKVGTVREAAR